ncbi:murein endopeptidase. Metallo peptidase. MEROPS family M74 [Faunimonas pinastri]|uniref:Murein endopeptidase. Metallo peptidase. MEROPS family M74 n=1 Tax=Faunimonas pinastri TaxID=1855383 RepID=A0A1H9GIL3_9HYPH|nr:penicillin-insensitive murein endopeptidase [Faunimonas pinastri]SEQ49926.1 murein endopeptidase. Metallo peptidase. MEROPS family M74 [Faunimonas pinastri]
MIRSLATALLLLTTGVATVEAAPNSDPRPAKQTFAAEKLPSAMQSQPIGFYTRGCQAGAVPLPPDGPTWQVMRLSRNRNWGQPTLINYLEGLAAKAPRVGWPGLLVGDLAMPRGGPLPFGHAAHNLGLEADIWLTPMPNRRMSYAEREKRDPQVLAEPGPHEIDRAAWNSAMHANIIHLAADDPRVDRIFVAPAIKKELCATATGDRSWLRVIRPWYGHNEHMHVRLKCPAGTACKPQTPLPPGDGCGAPLAYWYTDQPYAKPKPAKPTTPPKPPRVVTVGDLPAACEAVLQAPNKAGTMTATEMFQAAGGR